MLVDKRLMLVHASKMFYKMFFSTGLYKRDLTRKSRFLAKRVERKFTARDDHVFILPRDRLIPVNREVKRENDYVLPSKVIEHFIEKSGYRCIMNFCICRDANKCKDYPLELGCLFLGDAARNIHPEIGRSVSKEEALAHVHKCRDAGLVHLVGKGKLDTMWLDAYPGDKLMTICNCCPCCCVTMAVPFVAGNIRRKISRMPGVHVRVTEDCTGCGKCVESCMYQAITLDGDRAGISDEFCQGCGRCVDVCPSRAIELAIDDDRYVQQAIERLTPIVDVA